MSILTHFPGCEEPQPLRTDCRREVPDECDGQSWQAWHTTAPLCGAKCPGVHGLHALDFNAKETPLAVPSGQSTQEPLEVGLASPS